MAFLIGQTAAYLAVCGLIAQHDTVSPRVIVLCVALAGAARLPLIWMPDLPARDAIRYVWDARVQRAGLDPYRTRPDDLAVDHLHTALTRRVDASWLPTIYPPVAQLYFRGVTAVSESLTAFRAAAILSDLVTSVALMALLQAVGRPAAWSLLYAWHPVILYESAAGGHLDAFGVAVLTLGLLAVRRGRPTLAALLIVSAILVKPLPIVLAPLLWQRLRMRDVLVALVWASIALVTITGGSLPLGSLGAFVDDFRFNGPAFRLLTAALPPRAVAGLAVVLGLSVACWLRFGRRAVEDWATPQAVALVLAPVIYPWYLAWVVPFAVLAGSVVPWAWSVGVVAIYPAWWLASRGAPFEVPPSLLVLQYGLAAVVTAAAARETIRHR
ncbi:MAG: hypothetical protein AB1635_05460 [Acidobacteriota bacterium]